MNVIQPTPLYNKSRTTANSRSKTQRTQSPILLIVFQSFQLYSKNKPSSELNTTSTPKDVDSQQGLQADFFNLLKIKSIQCMYITDPQIKLASSVHSLVVKLALNNISPAC